MIRTLVDWAPGRHLPRTAGENAPACAYSIPSTLRPLLVAGVLSLLAWLGVYILFFSHSLWDSPSLVPDRWPSFFYPIEKLFPSAWLHAKRDTPLGRLNIGCWLALVSGLVALWVWAVRVAGQAPARDPRLGAAGMRIVLGGLLAFSLLLLFSPGLTSQDLYSNI